MRALFALPFICTIGHAQSLDVLGAVRQAEQHRGTVQAAELRLRAAESSYQAATPISPLRLEAGYGTFPTIGAGEDLLLALPIDLFGKNGAARSAAAAQVSSARATYRQARLDLQTEVMNAYAEVVSAQITLRTGQQVLELQQRSYDATKKRVDAGDLPSVELTRADLDLARSRAAAGVNEQTLRAARQRLSAAVGIDVAQEVNEDSFVIPARIGIRPDVQLAQAGLSTSRSELRTADAGRLPDVELQFRRAPWGQPELYNFRAQLVWNLWDWGAGAHQAKAARTDVQAAQRDLQDRTQSAAADVAASDSEVTAAQTSVDSFARLESDATELVKKEQSGYELGGNTLLGVLEATRVLRDIQASEADAKLRLIEAQARLLAARGVILTESP
jgi:outer membrane protein TolC